MESENEYKPKDFYFQVIYDIESKSLETFITLKSLWDRSERLDDQSLADQVIPSELQRICESQYQVNGMKPDEIFNKLLSMGFKKNYELVDNVNYEPIYSDDDAYEDDWEDKIHAAVLAHQSPGASS
jgi:hypothetical protein